MAACRGAVLRALTNTCPRQQQQQQAAWQRRRRLTVAAAGGRGDASADPHAVLQVPRGASRRSIRSAYIQRIRLLHPDVSQSGEDTTREAAAVNAAYEQLMQGFASLSKDDEDEDEGPDPLAVLDEPEAEPDQLFVDPWACYNVPPMQWRELQELARAAEQAGRDPWYDLRTAGVQCSEAAFSYLSPQQLAIVEAELERACEAGDQSTFEVAAWFVADCLARARWANARMPAARR